MKRTKTRQSGDLKGPAIRASACKQHAVYRIFQPQGQTQFFGAKRPAQPDRARCVSQQGCQTLAAVAGAVRRLDQPAGLPAPDRRSRFLETGDKHAFAPGKPQLLKELADYL